MSDVFPDLTVLGADALLLIVRRGGSLTPNRARQQNVATSTLKSLERRKLIEMDYMLRGRQSWYTLRLTDLGKAYGVVLQTRADDPVHQTLDIVDANRRSWKQWKKQATP